MNSLFRPTLKRSKLTTKASQTPYNHNLRLDNTYKLSAPADEKSKITIVPSAFLQNYNTIKGSQTDDKNQSKLLSPINSYDLLYPKEVLDKLQQPLENINNRGIGSEFGIYWLHINQNLYLWFYELQHQSSKAKLLRKFQFPRQIYTIAIGDWKVQQYEYKQEIQQFVLAIGFKDMIDLYFINKNTLDIKDMLVKFRVDYNQTLQKIKFTQNNELLFTGDAGHITRISFFSSSSPYRQKSPKKLIKVCEKASKFQFLLGNIFDGEKTVVTQQILASPNTEKIYVLLRQQKQISEIVQKWRKFRAYFSNRITNFENSRTSRKIINVYNVCGGSSLKYEGTIREQEIIKALDSNYSKVHNDLKNIKSIHDPNTSMICSIFLQKNTKAVPGSEFDKRDLLSVSLKSRHHFMMLESTNNITKHFSFRFIEEPSKFPDQFQNSDSEQMEGFGLLRLYKEKIVQEKERQLKIKNKLEKNVPEIQKGSKTILLKSLGYNNINFLSNKYCYLIDDQCIQLINFSELPNQIVQFTDNKQNMNSKYDQRTWVLFSKQKITVLRKLTLQQMLLTYFSAQTQLVELQIRTLQKKDQQKLKSFLGFNYLYHILMPIVEIMNQMSRIVGKNILCQMICGVLNFIIGKKMSFRKFESFFQHIHQSSQWSSFPINSDIKQLAKQQLQVFSKLKDEVRPKYFKNQTNRFKLEDWFYSIFFQNQQTIYEITEQTQKLLWRLLIIYAHEGDNVIMNYSETNYGSYWLYLMKNVSNIVRAIEKWTIYDFARRRETVSAIKQKLKIIEKMIKSKSKSEKQAFTDIYEFSQMNKEDNEKKKNSSNQYLLDTTTSTVESYKKGKQTQTTTEKAEIERIIAHTLKSRPGTTQSVSQLQRKICELVPKVLVSIQLYQLLGQKKREQKLPSFGQFISTLELRNKIKIALIQTFPKQKLIQNELIIKIHKLIPQLGLNQDLLFEKWFSHQLCGITQVNPSKTQQNARKIKPQDYDYQKLCSQLSFKYLKKLKIIFKNLPDCYINLLLARYEQNHFQTTILRKSEAIRKKKNQESIFEIDNENFSRQLVEELNNEETELKNQIFIFSQSIVFEAHQSRGQSFQVAEKLMNKLIKALEQAKEQIFIEHLYNYMKEQNLFIEKVHSIGRKLQKKNNKDFLGKISLAKNRPYMQSSLHIIKNQIQQSKMSTMRQEN